MDSTIQRAGLQNVFAFAETSKREQKRSRSHVCRYCGIAFKRSEHVTRHERGHTQEKPFNCPRCPCKFSRKDLLTRHDRMIHQERNDMEAGPKRPRRSSVTAKSSSSSDGKDAAETATIHSPTKRKPSPTHRSERAYLTGMIFGTGVANIDGTTFLTTGEHSAINGQQAYDEAYVPPLPSFATEQLHYQPVLAERETEPASSTIQTGSYEFAIDPALERDHDPPVRAFENSLAPFHMFQYDMHGEGTSRGNHEISHTFALCPDNI